MSKREAWASRLGVILAMAGSATGIGNFLRFPVQVANNGGGSFMIPYFIALLLIGLPLMWSEWAIGRYGGTKKHGSLPGMFDMLWKNRFAKYLGIFGVILPTTIMIFYLYIGSWTLAYAFFSLTGQLHQSPENLQAFLHHFQGVDTRWGVSLPAYTAFIVISIIVYLILSGGIAKGIERLAKIGMPALFILAVFLVVRVLMMGTPNQTQPQNNVFNGLGYLWNPDFSTLLSPRVWLIVAGQVFFALSLGAGSIHCYASYLKRKDDIVVSGMTIVSTDAFVEILLGGSIAIPAAVAFYGAAGMENIAHGGAYNLGFVSMPAVFSHMACGNLISFAWFSLLFIACLVASVSLAQPAISFFEDELGWTRRRSVLTIVTFAFLAGHISVFGLKYGAIDELDFWAGTVGLSVLALIEIILFVWVFGPKKAWNEIHIGAEARIPRIFLFILKYITPLALFVIIVSWAYQEGWQVISLRGLTPAQQIWRWGARLLLVAMCVAVAYATHWSWKKRRML